jgi:hypothetical protein
MDTTVVIQFIDAEITRLEVAKGVLETHSVPVERRRPIGQGYSPDHQANSQQDE